MSTAVIEAPATAELPQELILAGETILSKAMSLRVTDAATYEIATGIGKQLKDQKAARLDFFKPIKRAIDAAKSAVLDREKEAIKPLDAALLHLDTQSTGWRKQQEWLESEKRRIAEEEARAQIEAQRKADAKAAKAEGNKKLAEKILAAPIVVPAVEVAPSVIPQVAGLRRRTVWKFRVINAAKVPREWCTPDEKAIGEYVRENKEAAIGKIPGIEVYSDEHTI